MQNILDIIITNNNISLCTYKKRVNSLGWTPEKASTEKIMTKKEVGKLGAQKRWCKDANKTDIPSVD